MVSVVYAVRTPACEAGGTGSTPVGHPSMECDTDIGDEHDCKHSATTDPGLEPQLATGERRYRGTSTCVAVERVG